MNVSLRRNQMIRMASRILVCRRSPPRWSTRQRSTGELVTPYKPDKNCL
jgi:hypothetical protein